MAAKTNMQLIQEYEALIPYIESLAKLEPGVWVTPLEPGKWSLKDLLCHLMLWDKYFYEAAFVSIREGRPLTSQHLNFNEFNANAVRYAETVSVQEAISQFILYRRKITSYAASLSDEALEQTYKDGDGKAFSIRKHLRGFLPHDKHHKKQIERFLKTLQAVKADS
ncbi:DinB family protein [Paenibacillus sp. FSL K6-1096]|uniref:DinB family protein n=1 Tax=Paenibacillus sp. FSL K6-1096 TaxID=2921460 RepID=UPI0030EDF4CD